MITLLQINLFCQLPFVPGFWTSIKVTTLWNDSSKMFVKMAHTHDLLVPLSELFCFWMTTSFVWGAVWCSWLWIGTLRDVNVKESHAFPLSWGTCRIYMVQRLQSHSICKSSQFTYHEQAVESLEPNMNWANVRGLCLEMASLFFTTTRLDISWCNTMRIECFWMVWSQWEEEWMDSEKWNLFCLEPFGF